jgi:hypothetical protein
MTIRSLACLALALLAAACASPRPTTTVERLSPDELARLAPAPKPGLKLDDVVFLTRESVPPAIIIRRLTETGTILALTPAQIVDLGRQGVDQSVIDHIVSTHEKARQATVAGEIAARDAEAAARLAREREARQRAEARHWGYGHPGWTLGWGFGWSRGYPYGPGWPGWRRGW